jgi:replicative DNA helicase
LESRSAACSTVTTLSGGKTELNVSVHRNGPTKTVTVAHHLRLSRFEFMYSSNPAEKK